MWFFLTKPIYSKRDLYNWNLLLDFGVVGAIYLTNIKY